jgi:hypothetical protein
MIALIFFVLAALASPFKSKRRLEAENAALRHQLIILRRKIRGPGPADERRSLVLRPALSLVPVGLQVLITDVWPRVALPIEGCVIDAAE